MTTQLDIPLRCVLLLIVLAAPGCSDRDGAATAAQPTTKRNAPPPPTNRLDVPSAVRQNLGITFAKVERRRVAQTLRVPGRFELLPSARREYRTTLPGWVRLRAGQFDEVKAGTPLFELESPEWHRVRRALHEKQAAIEAATAELEVAQRAREEAEAVVAALTRRTEALAAAEVRRAELETELVTRRASVPRLAAEIKVKQAALNEARHDFNLEVDAAAALLGETRESLMKPAEDGAAGESGHADEHRVQRWFAIDKLARTAVGGGVVERLHVTDGTWVEANTLVATTVDPAALRFHATGLQSDLGRLSDGLPAAVVPPQGSGIDTAQVIAGKLKVGLAGDPDDRTIELLMTPGRLAPWAKPGVAAMLEIVTAGTGKEELAIPSAAVVRDELTHIFFRRDPKNPDKVIRMEADLGVSDGRWVVVNSGVKAGDEVVIDGVYELKLASSAATGRGGGKGHFHADGTWHAEEDEDDHEHHEGEGAPGT